MPRDQDLEDEARQTEQESKHLGDLEKTIRTKRNVPAGGEGIEKVIPPPDPKHRVDLGEDLQKSLEDSLGDSDGSFDR